MPGSKLWDEVSPRDEVDVEIPLVAHIPRTAFENGLVVIAAPDLDDDDIEALSDNIHRQLRPEVGRFGALIVNFKLDITQLDEDQMRELGWVRAPRG